MQNLKSIRVAEVDNFFKQSFEQKKLIPLYHEPQVRQKKTRFATPLTIPVKVL